MPRNRTPRTPKLRHHKASGNAVVTLDGKDFYLGKHGTPESREQYDRLIATWLAAGRRLPDDDDAPQLTVVEIIRRYLKHAARYYVKDGKPTSEMHLVVWAMRPLKALYARLPAEKFGPLALKSVRESQIERGLCRGDVNRVIGHIRRMFRWATENELIPPNVYHGLQAVAGLRKNRSEARETDPVTPVHETLVDAIRGKVSRQVWAMVELERLTGMRPGEVVTIRGCDLDMGGRLWVYTPNSHKTEHHGHIRTIHLGPQAQEVVKPFLTGDAAAHLFSPRDAEAERRERLHANRKTPLSYGNGPGTNRTRKPKRQPQDHYEVVSYRRAIHRACDAAGVPRWSPNRLRHNAATRLRKEYGLEAARVVLGHHSAAVTELYAEIDAAKAADIMLKSG